MAKKPSDLFEEEPKPERAQDFASLFERSLERTTRALKVGDQIKAEILSLGKEESFVSTGTALDGLIFNRDLLDENNVIKYKVGDVIDVVVMRVKNDEIRVTRKGSKAAPVELESLEDAFDMEIPVEGKVTEVVNGGYRVTIQGQPTFCPISQMDTRPVADPTKMIGQRLEFIITQFDPKKRNVVVSRRKLLDLQKAENEGEWLEKNKVGDIVQGVVSRTEQFGAFVDIGGRIDGLVHISEIGYTRLKHASEALNPGDPVQVKILKIDSSEDRLKLSLSIKQAGGAGDPWMQVPIKFPVATLTDGIVDKREAFGLFVVLMPGVSGLLPKSKWRDAENFKLYDGLKKGDPIKVRIDEIKFEERRISLGLPTEAEDESWREHQGPQKKGFSSMASAFSKFKVQS